MWPIVNINTKWNILNFTDGFAQFPFKAEYSYWNSTNWINGTINGSFHLDDISLLKFVSVDGPLGDLTLTHNLVDFTYLFHYFNLTSLNPANEEAKTLGQEIINDPSFIEQSAEDLSIQLQKLLFIYYKEKEHMIKTIKYTYKHTDIIYNNSLIKYQLNETYEMNYTNFEIVGYAESTNIPLKNLDINYNLAPINYISKSIINDTINYAISVKGIVASIDETFAISDFKFTMGYVGLFIPKVWENFKPYKKAYASCLATKNTNLKLVEVENLIYTEMDFNCSLISEFLNEEIMKFTLNTNIFAKIEFEGDILLVTCKNITLLSEPILQSLPSYPIERPWLAKTYISNIIPNIPNIKGIRLFGTGFPTEIRFYPYATMKEDYIVLSEKK